MNLKNIKWAAIALASVLSLGSCDDFGDINVDPNNPADPDTRYMFAYACKRVYTFAWNGTYNPWTQMFPMYIAERQNVQYGTFSVRDFATSSYYYENIQNLETIINLNSNEETKNESYVAPFGSNANQIAAARTLRAFYYMHLSDALGMLPYSEAIKGLEGNFTPKYDTQEFIYEDLDRDLTEAYAQFEESGSLDDTYDILYEGDITKWKKLNASLRMMMAIKLSDVNPSAGRERFAKAYADGGIEDNADRLEYKFLPEQDNENILYSNIVRSGRRDFSPSMTIIDSLKSYNDPRLYAYADPNSKGEYEGIPLGIEQTDVVNYADRAEFDTRFWEQDAPMVVVPASHILLLEAEAAVRGWITADAEDLYRRGIQASFDYYDVVGSMDANDKSITYTDFDGYMAQPKVQLTGSESEKIYKIAMQRWLANYLQNGMEAWSDWRRLNVPTLVPGPAMVTTHIPYRRIYTNNDYNANMDNYNAAIAQQGEDTYDTRVWWDTKDNE